MVDVLLYNAQNSEVVAYPHKSEYVDEPLVFSRAIEANSSKTPMRVKFDPDVLDFGIRFNHLNLTIVGPSESARLRR